MKTMTTGRVRIAAPILAGFFGLILLAPLVRPQDQDRDKQRKQPERSQGKASRSAPQIQSAPPHGTQGNRNSGDVGAPPAPVARPPQSGIPPAAPGPGPGNRPSGSPPAARGPVNEQNRGQISRGQVSPAGSVNSGRSEYGGRQIPSSSRVVPSRGGGSVVMRNNDRPAVVRTPSGVDIHHGLAGRTEVIRETPDHTRVVAERRGGYVQHPYVYAGHEYVTRTYYVNGRTYQRFYRGYPYRGVYLEVYAPVRYYPVGFYAFVGAPWVAPVSYRWGFVADPWYDYYGFYFRPYPVYYAPGLWLTDYLIAQSLAAAYQAQLDAQVALDAPPPPPQPMLTPEVKQQIADEVRRQIAVENSEAQANAQNADIDPANSGIAALLSDNQPHVFVAGSPLDLVNAAGQECAITEGDVLQLAGPPPSNAASATLIVLASKGGPECRQGSSVNVAFDDLQNMQNHMRQTLDQGFAELQSHQNGLPAPPSVAMATANPAVYAQVAPRPDPSAARTISEQYQQGTEAEQQTLSEAGRLDAPAEPPTVKLGQTPEQVTAAFGPPSQVVDLGAKKIYVYPNLKITFTDGVVSDVQ